MIREIEVSQLVAYLANKSTGDSFTCTFSQLRQIGSYIEQHDQTIRVELGERYYRAFRSRSVRHIVIRESVIEIEGLNSPVMKSLFRQYAPNPRIAALIEQAIKNVK